MRSFITLGVLSVVGAVAFIGCGDDDSDGPGTAGRGGQAGSANTGGGAGAGGAGGSGGGTAGRSGGGGGGAGGAPADVSSQATCTGCVELISPQTAPNSPTNLADQVGYQFTVAAPGADMTDGVLTWRVASVTTGPGHFITLYAQNGMALNYAGAYLNVPLTPAAFPPNVFQDILLDLSALPAAEGDAGAPPVVDAGADDAGAGATLPTVVGAFDKSQIAQYGIQIGVGTTSTGSSTLRVAVDSVTIEGVPGQVTKTFTDGIEGLAINQFEIPPGTQPPLHKP